MHMQLQSKQRQAKLVITYGSKLAKLKYLYLLTINLKVGMNNAHPNKQNLCRFLCKIVSVEGFFFFFSYDWQQSKQ